jgi:hypothetical protein
VRFLAAPTVSCKAVASHLTLLGHSHHTRLPKRHLSNLAYCLVLSVALTGHVLVLRGLREMSPWCRICIGTAGPLLASFGSACCEVLYEHWYMQF